MSARRGVGWVHLPIHYPFANTHTPTLVCAHQFAVARILIATLFYIAELLQPFLVCVLPYPVEFA